MNDREIGRLVSLHAIPSRKRLGGSRPYVFMEYGAAKEFLMSLPEKKGKGMAMKTLREYKV
jgi:hypothetical protein